MLQSVYSVMILPLLPSNSGGWNQQTGSQLSPARPRFILIGHCVAGKAYVW